MQRLRAELHQRKPDHQSEDGQLIKVVNQRITDVLDAVNQQRSCLARDAAQTQQQVMACIATTTNNLRTDVMTVQDDMRALKSATYQRTQLDNAAMRDLLLVRSHGKFLLF